MDQTLESMDSTSYESIPWVIVGCWVKCLTQLGETIGM
jgi:hypothetical protein